MKDSENWPFQRIWADLSQSVFLKMRCERGIRAGVLEVQGLGWLHALCLRKATPWDSLNLHFSQNEIHARLFQYWSNWVPVTCTVVSASPGSLLVNFFQRQKYCLWIQQNHLFIKRSLMDGLYSLQKHSSPCLTSLKHLSAWEQNSEVGMAESHTENLQTQGCVFSHLFLLCRCLGETWSLRRKALGIQIQMPLLQVHGLIF